MLQGLKRRLERLHARVQDVCAVVAPLQFLDVSGLSVEEKRARIEEAEQTIPPGAKGISLIIIDPVTPIGYTEDGHPIYEEEELI